LGTIEPALELEMKDGRFDVVSSAADAVSLTSVIQQ